MPTLETLDRFRQPEYTGENRCLPCTVVNTLIAAVLSVALAVGVGLAASPLAGVLAAVVVFGLSLALIYLRGYLVPGTPELTRRYFPPWLLGLFGKGPDGEVETIQAVDPEEELVAAGALEECEEGSDLCLTGQFRTSWEDELARVDADGSDRERLLALLELDDREVTFKEYGTAFRAYVDNRQVGTWESEAAYLADLAAANTLQSFHPRWESLALEAKSQLLSGLRLFIEQCPSCEGDPSFETDTVESCCSSYEVAAVSCGDCGARLFETRV